MCSSRDLEAIVGVTVMLDITLAGRRRPANTLTHTHTQEAHARAQCVDWTAVPVGFAVRLRFCFQRLGALKGGTVTVAKTGRPRCSRAFCWKASCGLFKWPRRSCIKLIWLFHHFQKRLKPVKLVKYYSDDQNMFSPILSSWNKISLLLPTSFWRLIIKRIKPEKLPSVYSWLTHWSVRSILALWGAVLGGNTCCFPPHLAFLIHHELSCFPFSQMPRM